MKDYTCDNPQFSKSVPIVEFGDLAHPDSLNPQVEQLLQNTLVLMEMAGNGEGVNTETGANGMRFWGGELQFFNNETQEWETIKTGGGGGGGSLPIYDAETETLSFAEGAAYYDERTETVTFGAGAAELLPATSTRLGGVKIGTGINVQPDGTISADDVNIAEVAAEAVRSSTDEVSEEEVDDLFNRLKKA